MYIYIYIYIYIYTYIYIYLIIHIHTYTSSCAWHVQRSSLEVLGRGTLSTYALESVETGCLPTVADRLVYPSEDVTLFELAMTAVLHDGDALSVACTSKNHCQKPRLSLCSIFWNKSRNQEEFFLIILVSCRVQSLRDLWLVLFYFASDYEKLVMSLNTKFRYVHCSDTHTQV